MVGISSDIKNKVEQCRICAENRQNRLESLLPQSFPTDHGKWSLWIFSSSKIIGIS